jgi:hypothetical protein
MLQFLLRGVGCLGLTALLWRAAQAYDPHYGPIGLVVSSIVWGLSFAPYLVEFFPTIKYWAEYGVSYRWHGRFYHFDGRQIRFYLIAEVIWVPLADVKLLMEPPIGERELRLLGHDCAIPLEQKESCLSEAGLLRLLNSRTEHRRASYKMVRFKRWLLQNALPNVKRHPQSRAN